MEETRASALFHEAHHDPPEQIPESTFEELYAEIATVETDDLEQLFAEWNRGSGRESYKFTEARYCDRCDTYIEDNSQSITHAEQNHGYDPAIADDTPKYIHGIRSLSVGDIAETDETYHTCAPVGWQELIVEGDW